MTNFEKGVLAIAIILGLFGQSVIMNSQTSNHKEVIKQIQEKK